MELRLIRHGVVDSTNELAFATAEAGEARHGDLLVAEGQTAGRGRRGSRWESAPGEGVYASLVLLPKLPVPRPVALTMGAGLGVVETAHALGLPDAVLKWPNDVVVQGAKLCGILVEARTLTGDRPLIVVGIGINVGQRLFSPTLEAERPVTSLRRQGSNIVVNEVLAVLCRLLPRRVGQALCGGEEIAADYLAATGLARRLVRLTTSREELRGRLTGLTFESGITLRQGNGTVRSLALEHVTAVAIDPGDEG